MYYAARIAKEKYPDAKIVFVGPCVAKRKEAQRDEAVDFVMTFEEISSISMLSKSTWRLYSHTPWNSHLFAKRMGLHKPAA